MRSPSHSAEYHSYDDFASLVRAVAVNLESSVCMFYCRHFALQPPTQNMNMGGGGIGKTGNGQSLHSQSNLNDSMATGTPPTLLIQGQINNGEVQSLINGAPIHALGFRLCPSNGLPFICGLQTPL